MCYLCFTMDKITVDEAVSNLKEMKDDVDSEHYEELIRRLDDKIIKEINNELGKK